jgi:uncharacterized protein (DUF4415 family)
MKKVKKQVMAGLDRDGTPDKQNPEWTAKQFKRAKKGLDGLAALVGEEAVEPLRKMGRPKSPAPKQNGTLRLSPEVWDGIKSTGKGYNARVEAVLRDAIEEGRI